MRRESKWLIVYFALLSFSLLGVINLARADQVVVESVSVANEEVMPIDDASLDQMLAPIALYPDTLLSQVLIAATYPLEVIKAARWQDKNQDLDEDELQAALELKDWDPSVKALVPYANLLQQLAKDLDWLERLGNAFLSNEEQLLARIQFLRDKARQTGSLQSNDYIEVVEEDEHIIVKPVEREVVYVPYYNTRVVYGDWHWAHHHPVYWHRPLHYRWHGGFYWSPVVNISYHLFDGGFRWHDRHVVVNRYYHRPRYREDGIRRVRVNEYQRWHHNSDHRRNVHYVNRHREKTRVYASNKKRDVTHLKTMRAKQAKHVRPINKERVVRVNNKKRQLTSSRTHEYKKPVRQHSYDRKPTVQQHKYRKQVTANKPRPATKPVRATKPRSTRVYSKPKSVNRPAHRTRTVSKPKVRPVRSRSNHGSKARVVRSGKANAKYRH